MNERKIPFLSNTQTAQTNKAHSTCFIKPLPKSIKGIPQKKLHNKLKHARESVECTSTKLVLDIVLKHNLHNTQKIKEEKRKSNRLLRRKGFGLV